MNALVGGMQLCHKDGGLKTDCAHARPVLKIPQNAFRVLRAREQVPAVGRPAGPVVSLLVLVRLNDDPAPYLTH